jgi:class 3 adenylate cyclase/tetratricopeptide (TPR) repeat protein
VQVPVCASCGRETSDDFAFCPYCGAGFVEPAAAQEQRKTVTILFCDIVGSTSLGESTDPEALRALLARYFESMKAVVEGHGGTVEKFIGDAVMAVFGVPVVHEDDAFRAVRAASEMSEAFSGLGVDGRIGIATGEVVTGTAERLATGDAVNVAARLEQAASPGAVLLSEETFQLVRNGVEVDVLEPLELKGKANRVAAYRLRSVTGEPARGLEAPMVGREREQRLLADAWERAVSERSCHLFTVLGPAGVGKSRLVAEFLSGLDPATVVRGRSLPYGEGITYWPAVEVIKQLTGVALDERAGAVVQGLLEDSPNASSEEIAWAFRKLLEAAAAQRPLICVLDDLHWAEQTFLDLVEHVADLSRQAPIVLLCMARPDLLDRRPGWGGGKINATTVLLEPLGVEETERLIESLADLDAGLAARIREASEGNPLFVEEMVAMVRESPSGDVAVPPTIQALLAARLDQLDQSERSVLQCGSVEGRVFHGGAVEALASEGSQVVTERLTGLVRKELVRPDTPVLRGEDAYRFRHLLIRDAAYDALPKAARAELHERFGGWLEAHGTDLPELDEIVGYHLEQAYQYRRSLGLDEERTDLVGVRAAERLASAGRRAFGRNDTPAAVNLLERAAVLWPEGDARRLADLPMLGRALAELGNWESAESLLTRAFDAAKAQGDDVVAADASVALWFVRLHVDPETTHDRVHCELDEAARVFEQAGDESRLASALVLSGTVLFWGGRADEALVQLDRALHHVRRAGDRVQELHCLSYVVVSLEMGPTPVAAALERIGELGEHTTGTQALNAVLLRGQAHLEAMQGQFDLARKHVGAARGIAEELGLTILLDASIPRSAGEIETLAANPAAAVRELGPSCERLEASGDFGHFASSAACLGDALLLLQRVEEAAPLIARASQWTLDDDVDAQVGWRRVRARILARAGEQSDAERLAREAVALCEPTDIVYLRGEALRDLAEVLELGGNVDESTAALEQALALYEDKGNVVMAGRMKERIAELTATRG